MELEELAGMADMVVELVEAVVQVWVWVKVRVKVRVVQVALAAE